MEPFQFELATFCSNPGRSEQMLQGHLDAPTPNFVISYIQGALVSFNRDQYQSQYSKLEGQDSNRSLGEPVVVGGQWEC